MQAQKEKGHLNVPVAIEVVLFDGNQHDRKLYKDIKKYFPPVSDDEVEFVFAPSMAIRELLEEDSYLNQIQKMKKMDSMALAKRINSSYFLYNMMEIFPNLRVFKFLYSKEKEYVRVINLPEGKAISIDYKVIYGTVDLSAHFDEKSINILNKKLVKAGFLKNRYMERVSFFTILARDFLIYLNSFAPSEYFDSDIDNIIENLFEIIDEKIEEDNAVLMIKTDYDTT